jgi:hypothetical protein
MTEAPFPVEQQRQPFGMGEPVRLGIGGKLAECPGHAGEPHGIQLIEGGMLKHHDLLQW